MIKALIIFNLSFFVTLSLRRYIIKMLSKPNNLKVNYTGKSIPVSAGLVFIPGILGASFAAVTMGITDPISLLSFLFAVMSTQLIGLIDDQIGDRSSTGLRGHFKMLFNGQLTTGAFKAISILFISILISIVISSDYTEILTNSLLISLFSNLINLLDLRPGRAVKSFCVIAAIFLIFASNRTSYDIFLIIMMGASLGYIYLDLKGLAMLGDCGSNSLGIVIGMHSAVSMEAREKIYCLGVLIIIHLIAEKWSITKVIERNRLLTFFDKIGR